MAETVGASLYTMDAVSFWNRSAILKYQIMEFTIKKEITETIKIEPPYYCRGISGHYKVTENGCLVYAFTRGVIVHDLSHPMTADSIKKAVTESVACTKEEFEHAMDEATRAISCALDRKVNIRPLPY